MSFKKALSDIGDSLVSYLQTQKLKAQVEADKLPLGSQEVFGGTTAVVTTPAQIAGISTGTILIAVLACFLLIKKRR